jgi:hypothetical protein
MESVRVWREEGRVEGGRGKMEEWMGGGGRWREGCGGKQTREHTCYTGREGGGGATLPSNHIITIGIDGDESTTGSSHTKPHGRRTTQMHTRLQTCAACRVPAKCAHVWGKEGGRENEDRRAGDKLGEGWGEGAGAGGNSHLRQGPGTLHRQAPALAEGQPAGHDDAARGAVPTQLLLELQQAGLEGGQDGGVPVLLQHLGGTEVKGGHREVAGQGVGGGGPRAPRTRTLCLDLRGRAAGGGGRGKRGR